MLKHRRSKSLCDEFTTVCILVTIQSATDLYHSVPAYPGTCPFLVLSFTVNRYAQVGDALNPVKSAPVVTSYCFKFLHISTVLDDCSLFLYVLLFRACLSTLPEIIHGSGKKIR